VSFPSETMTIAFFGAAHSAQGHSLSDRVIQRCRATWPKAGQLGCDSLAVGGQPSTSSGELSNR
jgi:hypothetical protein